MKLGYVDTPDGQIHYRSEGKGRPLILLHQACISSEEFSLMIPILGKKFFVLAPDFPGHGCSYLPPGPYSIEDYARSVIAFMDGLGIRKASLAGHHSGASVAVEFSVAHPQRIDKVVLSGCPVYRPGVRESRLRGEDPRYVPMKIAEDGSYLLKVWQTEKAKSGASLPIWHRMVLSHLMAGERDHDLHYAVFRYDIERRLPLIKRPTLIVSGDRDLFYDMLDYTQGLVPRSRTGVIRGGYLRPALDKPAEFAQAITEFLESPAD